jgi:hypothetical protein
MHFNSYCSDQKSVFQNVHMSELLFICRHSFGVALIVGMLILNEEDLYDLTEWKVSNLNKSKLTTYIVYFK